MQNGRIMHVRTYNGSFIQAISKLPRTIEGTLALLREIKGGQVPGSPSTKGALFYMLTNFFKSHFGQQQYKYCSAPLTGS